MAGGLFQLRAGEWRKLAWVGAIGIAFAAAVAIGNDVAESIFVTRVGERQLPLVFLAKGLFDVVAAALYLPIARGRSERGVLLAALAIYVATVLGARTVVEGGSDISAFALFIGHETAWTILTIHWGVFVLDVFDASQARRLFPILFTVARAGGILAGVLVQQLARPLGVANLLFLSAGFAALAGVVSLVRSDRRRIDAGTSLRMEAPGDRAPYEADDELRSATRGSILSRWREAARSPLVRIIAVSTAAMVLVRYGLHMVALGEIAQAMEGDRDRVAAFLGLFGAIANGAGILLGLFVVPRILTRLGVGFANVLYAACTIAAYTVLAVAPSLGAAVTARFVRVQLKDSLKTPLSALFYGAEPPEQRAPARAFIFGAAIPLATVITAGVLEGGKRIGESLEMVIWLGLAVAVAFAFASWIQNHRWRRRLEELLRWKLERTDPPDPARHEAARDVLEPYAADLSAGRRALLDDAAAGLASSDDRLRAVAEEVLSELIPRARAHAVAARRRDVG